MNGRFLRLHQLSGSRNIRNSFWIIAEQIFQMMISLFVGLLSARYLGPGNYGLINYTASFISFFSVITTLGMEGVVLKKLIEHPEEEGDYLGGCIFFRFCASICSIISIEMIIALLNPDDTLKLLLGLIQGFQLSWKSILILDSWFQRHLCSKYVSIGKAGACISVAFYRIYLLVTHKSVVWFAFSAVISEMVISLTVFMFYSRKSVQKVRLNIKKGIEVLQESYHFIISDLMVAVYSQMDKIMIGSYLGVEQVGYYTTANAISSMWLFIPMAVINSFRPMILELKNNGKEWMYRRQLEQLYSALIWICIIFSIFICIFSSFIIQILYGKAFIKAAETLRICIWYELFAVIGTARGIWILAEKKNRYVKYILGIGAVINVILNIVWIPVFGINGAAYATLITQIVTSLIAPLFFRETRCHTGIVLKAFICNWYFCRRES